MNKLIRFFTSPVTMVIVLFIGAVAMGTATFIENDFGAAQARELVYGAKWFELLLFVFCLNLIASIFYRKLYMRKKISIFLFHLAFIVMIIGAACTRYFGFEGMMHIREGNSSDYILTQTKGLNLTLENNQKESFIWNERDLNNKRGFEETVKVGNEKVSLQLKQILPNAFEKPIEDANGEPTIGLVLAGNDFRGSTYIIYGETKTLGESTVAFGSKQNNTDFNFLLKDGKFFMQSKAPITEGGMQDDKIEHKAMDSVEIVPNKLYHSKGVNLVVQELYETARIIALPVESNKNIQGNTAYLFNVSTKSNSKDLIVWEGAQQEEDPTILKIDDIKLSASYGLNKLVLPFEIHLDDFVIDRYPGSMSPSSFSSYVQIKKEGQAQRPFHIYMNNILKLDGFRFYQSSYDKDEKGSILSVNYDGLGTTVTYIGYFLLFLGILWSMLNKNTFLRKTVIPKSIIVIAFISMGFGFTNINASPTDGKQLVDIEHANRFGELQIQDHRGRTEPIYTFASDLMRKISRKEKMHGVNPVQLFLEMNVNSEHWMTVPLIKVSNKDLAREIGIKGKYAAYNDFIISGMGYKLQKQVEAVYNKAPAKRSKYDKELMKVDERLNICYAIYNGTFLKIFPVKNATDDRWDIASIALKNAVSSEDSNFLANIIPVYFQELNKAKQTNNYKLANEYLEGIFKYQKNFSSYELPSEFKTKLEVKYNQWNIFKKLFPYYSFWGVIFLFVLIGAVISGKELARIIIRIFTSIIFLGFLGQTVGIAIRWYISGHAPMSNGYESMIFISWVTMLAGFIFGRQSSLALSATSILAGFTLMVANLSFMDPEITNLVPVLKSYWLTVHVSVITGSYGFLGLGAILGIINLTLVIFQNKKNHLRIEDTIETLTKINHRTLILGLYFLTIGTFLGAVWANESWGRYWGWDPKETWSLITMIIYTIVTHARMVPGIKGRFAFNTLSIYAFFSVLMTYFGVNYYLSGLHSYAAGDPVPIPNFVYVSVAALILLSVLAWNRTLKNRLVNK
ncbi:MAG: c-type cytochrome biogenesis protein CcsB [Salinivirgaceae bacterium]|nr:c-type cytochrome biogenesis protein CcsB [Salinivirgaceae bacterium]